MNSLALMMPLDFYSVSCRVLCSAHIQCQCIYRLHFWYVWTHRFFCWCGQSYNKKKMCILVHLQKEDGFARTFKRQLTNFQRVFVYGEAGEKKMNSVALSFCIVAVNAIQRSQFHWVAVMKICIKYKVVYCLVENPLLKTAYIEALIAIHTYFVRNFFSDECF